MVWISVESVVISPLSFLLHLFGCAVFSFQSIWLVVCLFCWSFQKTSSWIYWFFWRVFRVSVSFSSALILVISCLLLGFDFFWSCSSSSFNFDDRVSLLDLYILLIWALIAIYFPLETALNVSQKFWYVVSSFSSVSNNFFISDFISLFIQSTFKNQLFSFHEAVWFWISFWILSSNLIALWSERLLWFQLFCICWAVLYFQLCGQF